MTPTMTPKDRLYHQYHSVQEQNRDDRRAREPYLRDVIRRLFPADRNCSIMDVGCGAGTFMSFLRREGYLHVKGVDVSLEQVTCARRKGVEHIIHGDVLETLGREPSASLDVIVAFDLLEHLTLEQLLRFSDDAFRTLRDNGIVLVHTANAEGRFGSIIRWADLTHERAFTRDSIAQLFRSSGFARIACYEDKPVIHGIGSLVRRIAYAVLSLSARAWLVAENGRTGFSALLSQNLLAVVTKSAGADDATGPRLPQ